MIDVSGLDADSSHPGLDASPRCWQRARHSLPPGALATTSNTGLLSGSTDADSEAEFESCSRSKPAHLVLDRDIRPMAPGIPPLPPPLSPPGPGPIVSGYDKTILLDQPTLFLPLADAGRAMQETDRMHADREGTYHHAVSPARMPNGDGAAGFDGLGSYFEFPDAPDLSVIENRHSHHRGVAAPGCADLPDAGRQRLSSLDGKGELGDGATPDRMEWAARIYGANNTDIPWRENRISGYAYNMEGGRGIGSYFQDDIGSG